ncbi:MAG: hypothetical protein J6Y29_06715 [Clostridiales bacterium]|nr:hypothetical protein [Clostridiales bacterium]
MFDIVMFVGDFLVDCAMILLSLIGSIVVVGLVLGILKSWICQYMQYALGFGGVLITAWIGTPIHELGHALLCYVFHHKVREVRLFNPDIQSGVLGYVNHSYDKRSVYQKIGNFFIGIAPILSGTGVIMLLMALLLPNECNQMITTVRSFSWPSEISLDAVILLRESIEQLFSVLFTAENIRSVSFWIFIYLAVSISSHMALSKADLRGASSGIGTMYILIVLANIVIRLFNIDMTSVANVYFLCNSYLIAMLTIAVFCSLCSFLISIILYGIRSAFV